MVESNRVLRALLLHVKMRPGKPGLVHAAITPITSNEGNHTVAIRGCFSTDLNKVRNIGIMAHIDAGKTVTNASCSTRTNYKIRQTHRRRLDDRLDGTGAKRGITITSAAALSETVTRSTLLTIDLPLSVERLAARPDGVCRRVRRQGVAEPQSTVASADKYDVSRNSSFIKQDGQDGADFYWLARYDHPTRSRSSCSSRWAPRTTSRQHRPADLARR